MDIDFTKENEIEENNNRIVVFLLLSFLLFVTYG